MTEAKANESPKSTTNTESPPFIKKMHDIKLLYDHNDKYGKKREKRVRIGYEKVKKNASIHESTV